MAQKKTPTSRSHLRLTLAGWLFLLVSVMVGLAAVKTQVGLLFVIFGGMMGALHISLIMARRAVRKLQVGREAPSRAWQSQIVHVGYYLRNRRKRGGALGLTVSEIGTDAIEAAAGYCVWVPGGSSFRAGARFTAKRRGKIDLHVVEVHTTFPFGLVRASRSFVQPAELLVWPAKGRLIRRMLQHGATEVSRAQPSRRTGGQDEFFGLREYRTDDSPRWIHWRKSAGRAQPVVREMAQSLPDLLWIVLDTQLHENDDVGSTDLEKMIRFAATLADYAFTRGFAVGLAWADAEGPRQMGLDSGVGQRRKILDALAEIGPNQKTPLARTVASLGPGSCRNAQVVVLAREQAQLRQAPLDPLRSASRSLRVLQASQLGDYFADNPHATGQVDGPNASAPTPDAEPTGKTEAA